MKAIALGISVILFLVAAVLARVGGGDITFKEKTLGNVIFSHDSHVAGIGLKCTNCHASPYVTKEKHRKVTVSQMKKGKSCGECHNGKKAFDIKDCENCHNK